MTLCVCVFVLVYVLGANPAVGAENGEILMLFTTLIDKAH